VSAWLHAPSWTADSSVPTAVQLTGPDPRLDGVAGPVVARPACAEGDLCRQETTNAVPAGLPRRGGVQPARMADRTSRSPGFRLPSAARCNCRSSPVGHQPPGGARGRPAPTARLRAPGQGASHLRPLAAGTIVRRNGLGGLSMNTTERPRDENPSFLTAHPAATTEAAWRAASRCVDSASQTPPWSPSYPALPVNSPSQRQPRSRAWASSFGSSLTALM